MNAPDHVDTSIATAFVRLPERYADFAQLYRDELQPKLAKAEQARLAGVKKQRTGLFTGLGIGGVGSGIGLAGFEEPLIAMLSGMAGFGVYGWSGGDLRRVQNQTKSQLILPIAQDFDFAYDDMPDLPPSMRDFQTMSLLPNWDRAKCEDKFNGHHNGTDFEFYEAHLEQRRQTSNGRGGTRTTWVTVFKGQTLSFNVSKPIKGQVILRRDKGWFNKIDGMFSGKLERVTLESSEFEKAFEVYATDQIEARVLLTPQFMRTLIDLENTLHGANLRCAFVGDNIRLVTEGGNLFEPGSMFVPLDNPERVTDLLLDFDAVFNVIDAVRSR